MSIKIISLFLLCALFISCDDNFVPKPRGFYRIDFPEKKYQAFNKECPFTFQYPEYAQEEAYKRADSVNCWYNIIYPRLNAQLYMSYFGLTNNLEKHIEDSRALTYKHTVKADAINEKVFSNPQENVFGMYYQLKGDAA